MRSASALALALRASCSTPMYAPTAKLRRGRDVHRPGSASLRSARGRCSSLDDPTQFPYGLIASRGMSAPHGARRTGAPGHPTPTCAPPRRSPAPSRPSGPRPLVQLGRGEDLAPEPLARRLEHRKGELRPSRGSGSRTRPWSSRQLRSRRSATSRGSRARRTARPPRRRCDAVSPLPCRCRSTVLAMRRSITDRLVGLSSPACGVKLHRPLAGPRKPHETEARTCSDRDAAVTGAAHARDAAEGSSEGSFAQDRQESTAEGLDQVQA